MAGCPFNKWKQCKKNDCELFRELTRFDAEGNPEVKRGCVFNFLLDTQLDYLHGIKFRLEGLQQANEQVRNIFAAIGREIEHRQRVELIKNGQI